jgi:hypothetical protein
VAHRAKPLSPHILRDRGLILMPRIRQNAIHKRGSEGAALAGAGRSPFAASRSSADYAARGERGEPRGRKSGGGEGTDNLTWPARAEGEKRFRSLTRNP